MIIPYLTVTAAVSFILIMVILIMVGVVSILSVCSVRCGIAVAIGVALQVTL